MNPQLLRQAALGTVPAKPNGALEGRQVFVHGEIFPERENLCQVLSGSGQISAITASMAGPDDWTETARRVRAAMAYGNVNRAEAATAMETTPGTLDRIAGKKGGETKLATWQQLWRLAAFVGLPPEFFSADFGRMAEIVPAGAPTVVRASSSDAASVVDDSGARAAIAAAQAGPPPTGGGRRRSAARGSARASRAR